MQILDKSYLMALNIWTTFIHSFSIQHPQIIHLHVDALVSDKINKFIAAVLPDGICGMAQSYGQSDVDLGIGF